MGLLSSLRIHLWLAPRARLAAVLDARSGVGTEQDPPRKHPFETRLLAQAAASIRAEGLRLSRARQRTTRLVGLLDRGCGDLQPRVETRRRELGEQRQELKRLPRSRHGDGLSDAHFYGAQATLALIELPLTYLSLVALPLDRYAYYLLVVGFGVGSLLTADMIGWALAQSGQHGEQPGARHLPQTLLLSLMIVGGLLLLGEFAIGFNEMRMNGFEAYTGGLLGSSGVAHAVISRAVAQPVSKGGLLSFQACLLLVALHLSYTRKLGARRRELTGLIGKGERSLRRHERLLAYLENRRESAQARLEGLGAESRQRLARILDEQRLALALYAESYRRRQPAGGPSLNEEQSDAWDRLERLAGTTQDEQEPPTAAESMPGEAPEEVAA